MKATQLLRTQFDSAHHTMEQTVGDATATVMNFNKTNKAIPVGAAYAHAVLEEDLLLSSMLANKKPVYKDAKSVGLSQEIPGMDHWDQHEKWYLTVKVDLKKFRAYAKKVYKATDDYLATLTDKDLDMVIERPMVGKQTVGFLLTNFFLLHIANLAGEVSAAKGFQGLKGYPW